MVDAPYTVGDAMAAGWPADEAKAFSTFMTLVNRRVESVTGLGVLDFPDWHWADAFKDRLSVSDTVVMFLSDMEAEGEWGG